MKTETQFKRACAMLSMALTLTLAACGGGGGNASDTSLDGATAEAAAVGTDSHAANIHNLRIDPDNTLDSVDEITIDVQPGAARSYLSICSGLAENADPNAVKYDACELRAPLDAGGAIFSLALPRHIDRLTAVIWYYEPGRQPLLRHWRRANAAGVAPGIWYIRDR